MTQDPIPQPASPNPAPIKSNPIPIAKAPAAPALNRPGSGPASPERRQLMFSWLSLAWITFAAATLAALSTMMRFMFPNVLFEPSSTFKAGKTQDYELGVDERWKEKYGVWIVRNMEGIFALSTTCTHLGCTPNWLETEQKFKCPCHGSGFYKSGINFEGPAPRPLERYRVSLADDGQIVVDKSKKFQQEKGDWNNPESFLAI